MSDYGADHVGEIAALTGLSKRVKEGGSWWDDTSLVGYNASLLSIGLYPLEVVKEVMTRFKDSGFYGKEEGGLNHSDSVDDVGSRELQLRPELFDKKDFHAA